LSESEVRPIILRGTVYKALWDGKVQEMMAESDRVTLPKGSYLKLEEAANRCP